MRFSHLADCHIGAWRDPAMKELPLLAFERAVTVSIERKVDFLLLAGDFFNTAVPPLDQVKRAVTQLQLLKEAKIPVYAIAGSHDYSPSGKTMLDVLEEAGLLVNVMKGEIVEKDGKEEKNQLRLRFTSDPKTGVKLTGILGRAGSLDKHYYEDLDRSSLEREPGQKIFLFHAPITELKPKELSHMESSPISMMPKGFDYYAGGHVHIVNNISLPGYKQVVYPGPVFPASFSELEELGTGSFVIVDDWKVERIPIAIKERIAVHIDCDKRSANAANAELEKRESEVKEKAKGNIILLRLSGELSEGRISDLKLKELVNNLYQAGAFFVMKNTARLSSKEFSEYQTGHGSAEEMEQRLWKEHAGQFPLDLSVDEEVALAHDLLEILGEEQPEGAKKYEHEERVLTAAKERLQR